MNCSVEKCVARAEYGEIGKDISRCKQHARVKDTKNPFEGCTH